MNIERDSDPIVNSVPYSVARSIRLINRKRLCCPALERLDWHYQYANIGKWY